MVQSVQILKRTIKVKDIELGIATIKLMYILL